MLTLILAHTGSEVIIPDAVAMKEDGANDGIVQFVDAAGKVVAIFQRESLAVMGDGNLLTKYPDITKDTHDGIGGARSR